MSSVVRFVPALFLTSAALLFGASQPSAKADRALRARIDEFYTLEVNHQFRQAEPLVSENSKDFFYNMKKPDYLSWSIEKIDYAPDFKSAIVKVHIKGQVFFPGAGPVVMESTSLSNWRLEKGKWYWYFDKNSLQETPFGKSRAQVSTAGPVDPVALMKNAMRVGAKGAVEADRRSIQLDAANPKPETITLKNLLSGPATVKVLTSSPALKIALAKATLGPAETTQLTITPVPGASERPASVNLSVLPLNEPIQIAIAWAPSK